MVLILGGKTRQRIIISIFLEHRKYRLEIEATWWGPEAVLDIGNLTVSGPEKNTFSNLWHDSFFFFNPHSETCFFIEYFFKREKHGLFASYTCPKQGSNLKPTFLPWPGIEPHNLSVHRMMLQSTELPGQHLWHDSRWYWERESFRLLASLIHWCLASLLFYQRGVIYIPPVPRPYMPSTILRHLC